MDGSMNKFCDGSVRFHSDFHTSKVLEWLHSPKKGNQIKYVR